jgi:hypothetical protein
MTTEIKSACNRIKAAIKAGKPRSSYQAEIDWIWKDTILLIAEYAKTG